MTGQSKLSDRERRLLAELKRSGYVVKQMNLRNRWGRTRSFRRVVRKAS